MTTSKDNIGKQVAAIAKQLGCKYTYKGQEIDPVKAFGPEFFLPEVMRRADQLCSFCLGYGLGVDFSRADESELGITVNFDDKGANSLRLLCCADVLTEMLQNSPNSQEVALDEFKMD